MTIPNIKILEGRNLPMSFLYHIIKYYCIKLQVFRNSRKAIIAVID